MFELHQSERDRIVELVRSGAMTAAEGNVAMIRARRVFLVTSKVSRDVRNALNDAVKAGNLGHVKKDGHKPEAYFHPDFEVFVAGERNKHERAILRYAAAVLA